MFLLLALASSVYGSEAFSNVSPIKSHPHHFYVGGTFLRFWVDTDVRDVNVRGDINFGGIFLGYEYINPCSFYFGISALSTASFQGFDGFKDGKRLEGNDAWFGNFEIRWGRAYATSCSLICPYVGLGLVGFVPDPEDQGYTYGLIYAGGGAKTLLATLCGIRIGLNVQLFFSIRAGHDFRLLEGRRVHSSRTTYGGELGIPFRWCFGRRGCCAIELEPYFLSLDFSSRQDAVGGRARFIYRF